MSMGQRQRVRLAMAFLPRPLVVLLDEPRNSLDSEGVGMLVAAVDRVVERGGTAVWCSPSGEENDVEFDRRFTIVDGRLEEQYEAALR
jgi:ABC-type multidrug transport system ATPase subunit